ncbi:BREX system ATP-binding domain-containing protein [Sulfobacillus harzensis]|uniref:DUF2791 family P-loop domain-containing protein n=1 Tax=Sulfobacillus harzensis TaxID=2729629 RepID=A0A7Y0L7Z0_9FIRM|nr:BREX system ATP-binding domain-containing protein [Sulfobacillus harzensis]NMP24972.1 DUF2791 family P-loop domain-containing protein [Sulfobacillus harzensis]
MNGDGSLNAVWLDASAWPNAVIQEAFVDPLGIEGFWRTWYLEGFVDQGHGKVKCVIGRPGSGKTHVLRHLGLVAKEIGYQVAWVDFAKTKVAAIDDLYRVVAGQVDWENLLNETLIEIIGKELGYPEFDGNPRDFITWGEVERQVVPALLRRDLREAIDRWLRRADWHPEFRLAVRTWMQEQIGDLVPEDSPAALWLQGEKLGASQRKTLGVKSNVTRRNARALLASLASLAHLARGRGLLVLLDNVHVVALTTRLDGRPYYTKGARDQVYEMLRQLIDESPFTPYLMTILAGTADPLHQAKAGFPSYPALWERLQTEVQSNKVNRFSDMVDLDRLWDGDEEAVIKLRHAWSREAVVGMLGAEFVPDSGGSLGLEWGQPRRLITEVWQTPGERGHVW